MSEAAIELLAQRVLSQEVKAIAKAAAVAGRLYTKPTPGSAVFADRDWASKRPKAHRVQGLFDITVGGIGLLLRAMEEYATFIDALLASERTLPLPIMSCART
ncbi:hypothetical protein J7E80_16735 [Arthrobacter sp. ISL-28]|nr:hypothetical protein [Arthrobacter sp. ISL-28]